jgi:hypothetical protein
MSAIAGPNWDVQNDGLRARFSPTSVLEETAMREKLVVIRDTMIVLSMQLVFRTVMLLRRWNY